MNFVQYERDYLDGDREPTLVKLKPTIVEEVKEAEEEGGIEVKAKVEYQERPWRIKNEAGKESEKKEMEFYHMKVDKERVAQYALAQPYTEKHNILVQNLPLALQIRRELIASSAQTLCIKLKEKQIYKRLIETIFKVSDSLEKKILKALARPQDQFVFTLP